MTMALRKCYSQMFSQEVKEGLPAVILKGSVKQLKEVHNEAFGLLRPQTKKRTEVLFLMQAVILPLCIYHSLKICFFQKWHPMFQTCC
jgi:hypothetical protein